VRPVGPQSSLSSLESRGKSVSFSPEPEILKIGIASSPPKYSKKFVPAPAHGVRFGALKSALKASKLTLRGVNQRRVVA